jgi:transposase
MLRAKRSNFPEAYRRAIVAMTLRPGASTSEVARENGLNVNMVFKWRQRFKKEFAGTARISESV